MGAVEQEKKAVTQESEAGKKSGLRKLSAGEILFNDGDHGGSLYIIQKGQLRLFKPKGKGFIELAVLRAGEVLGEMAYFDDEGSPTGGKRSCSASALVATEIIEISFQAFGKTINSLNPWFKTIINTLASRLRKANSRIKELETNSVTKGYGGKGSEYQFISHQEVVRGLTVIFLAIKAVGKLNEKMGLIHQNSLQFYAYEVFNLQESKFEELINIVKRAGFIKIDLDKDNLPKMIVVQDLDLLKQMFNFISQQRIIADDKKIQISLNCETILFACMHAAEKNGAKTGKAEINFSKVISELQAQGIRVTDSDLDDARKLQFVGDTVVGENNVLQIELNIDEINKYFPSLRLINEIKRTNEAMLKKAG